MLKPLILFVDDEPDTLTMIASGLEQKGFAVLQSSSGEGALDLLNSNTPDLIIADLRMQPMNGFELFQQVKKNPKFVTTPFLFFTAVDEVLAKKYGQKLGVDAYITKPIELDDLVSIINNKLGRK
jgi:DNA-binding response OmpR family regulator